MSTFPALVPGLHFPYAVPIRNSGNKGVSFNFGKMNATQANKAQRALWEMM